jgi:Spy/CpxP family protein refolding chaperone
MKTGRNRMKVMLLSTALLFFTAAAAATIAGAQGGNAMMGSGQMQGGGMMGPGMMGPNAQLTPEERQKIAAANADFWKKTEDLRGDIYRKRLEMQIEMSKKSPDEATLMKIEDELLALQGQVAKLRIKHRLALKAINPRLGMMGPGMMRGGMMGQGMGHHQGMMGGCMKKRGMMGGQGMGMGRGAGMQGGGMMGQGMGRGSAMMPANPAAPTAPPAAGSTGSSAATQ